MKPTRSLRLLGTDAELPFIEGLLAAEGFLVEPIALHPKARRLVQEPFPVGRSLAAHFGRIYIQDQSSMIPPVVLAPQPGDVVLDLCASPGSKTGMLADAVGPNGLVVANEPNPRRLATLRANQRLLGMVEVITTSFASFPDLPCGLRFPRILVDAPCSGWGTANKHPEVLRLWRDEKTHPLERLQQQLLARAAALLAPGGTLVYSTCTTNARENEDQLAWALDHLDLVPGVLPQLPGIATEATAPGALRVVDPHGQGFFVAIFQRPGTTPPWPLPPGGKPVGDAFPQACSAWQPLRLVRHGQHMDLAPTLALNLDPLPWRGWEIGRVGKHIAWSLGCWRLESLEDCPVWVVEDPLLLSRLIAGESLTSPGPEGRIKLCFGNLVLGWAIRRGSRIVWTKR